MFKIQYQKILDEMKLKIESEEWVVGTKLPTISQSAAKYKVGNSTIREVYRSLETKGYVSIQQGRGTFVAYDGSMQFTNVSRSSFMKLLKLTEFRIMIEPSFAAEAAQQAFNNEIEMITESTNIMRELAENKQSTHEEDLRFHKLIVQATHNEYAIKAYAELQEELMLMHTFAKKEQMIEKAVHYHQMIARSIASRDANNARMYMQSHMEAKNSELAMYELLETGLKN
ncbi:FadR/GntR family transcriptional regulator [Lentibacillus sp. CBA3610]|uniref:FadR/GntR family transcriptional regulator n=1 Tax=Lentibacillus sp. CBA3610 TaxID=2518176 RepID=UPI001596359F|nr:FCD domain-containing protein [Lentibacillus sp. CBA3610]QKY70051.1 FadR family transcriptional regulator [Lentibacillus sp. CBA3610]